MMSCLVCACVPQTARETMERSTRHGLLQCASLLGALQRSRCEAWYGDWLSSNCVSDLLKVPDPSAHTKNMR